jgi:o-succinylbenzoate---CoA ligase
MDATRLIDPAFWMNPEPLAAGDEGVTAWSRGVDELERHVLFQTSGSSGAPKWIALSKTALLLSAATVNRHLDVDENACWGLTLPLHHVGGFGVVARAYEAACRLAIFPGKWQATRFTEWSINAQLTHVSLVPTQVFDLVLAGLKAPPSLRVIVVGGGRLEAAVGKAARALGWPVLASYGMTETCSQIATQSLELLDSPYQPAPLPVLDIWKVANDPEGRLLVAGPALFTGSVSIQKGVLEWLPKTSEWQATDDRVFLQDRELTVLGRMDAVVKVMGELVDPEAIERELMSLSGDELKAGSFAVLAVPDERAEHRLVPVFEETVPEDLRARVLRAYAASAPGFRRLAEPQVVAAMPRSDLGKIRRAALSGFLSH